MTWASTTWPTSTAAFWTSRACRPASTASRAREGLERLPDPRPDLHPERGGRPLLRDPFTQPAKGKGRTMAFTVNHLHLPITHVPRNRFRHLGCQAPAAGRCAHCGRYGRCRRAPAAPPAHLERAAPRRLVGRRGECCGAVARSGSRTVGAGAGHRPLGPHAWRGGTGRAGPGAAPGHLVERRPRQRRMCAAGIGCAHFAPDHRQSRHARLHRAQAAVAAHARARRVRPDPHRAAAQGLAAPATHWRCRERHVRRIGHAVAGRPGPRLEPGHVASLWARCFAHADAGRGQCAHRHTAQRCGTSLGASGVVFRVTDAFAPATERAVHAFAHALPQRWHHMSVMLSAASAFGWVTRLTGRGDEAQLSDAVSVLNTTRRAQAPLFLPYLSGERTPHNNAAATGVFMGLRAEHEAADLAYAVMEGVGFGLLDGLNAMRAAGPGKGSDTGRSDAPLALVGGGARSSPWAQLLASALGTPLQRPQGAHAAAALGAARLAAMACGGER